MKNALSASVRDVVYVRILWQAEIFCILFVLMSIFFAVIPDIHSQEAHLRWITPTNVQAKQVSKAAYVVIPFHFVCFQLSRSP